jgi:hypothetical protein
MPLYKIAASQNSPLYYLEAIQIARPFNIEESTSERELYINYATKLSNLHIFIMDSKAYTAQ